MSQLHFWLQTDCLLFKLADVSAVHGEALKAAVIKSKREVLRIAMKRLVLSKIKDGKVYKEEAEERADYVQMRMTQERGWSCHNSCSSLNKVTEVYNNLY